MKKIPTLDDLRHPAPGATAPEASPPEGFDTQVAPLIDAGELPAEVLAHAVKLGEQSVDAAARPGPKRGAQRKGAGGRMQVRRRYARERAVQALYAWDIGGASASEVLRYFLEQQDMSRADVEFFEAGFKGVAHAPAPIDALIAPAIDRGFDELDPVERAILRFGVWELCERADTPVRVVINEAVEVAKRFGAEQGHRFVNGVLDTVAREVRAAEIG